MRRPTSIMAFRALALTLVLLAAACGANGDPVDGAAPASPEEDATEPAGSDPAGDDASGELERDELRVGVLPLAHLSPLHHAIEAGYFEEEGLTVTPESAIGGAATIPAMVSGELDASYGNYVSYTFALAEGIELALLRENDRGREQAVYTLPDSPLDGPEDLEGASLAINTLNNIGHLAVVAALDDAGVDHETVNFTEIPFPEMGAALDRGDVDAVWLVEPFATLGQQNLDVQMILDTFEGTAEQLPVAGWTSTQSFADENPNTVAAFARALHRAAEDLANDEGLLREVIASFTEIPAEVVEVMELPLLVVDSEPADLQQVPDLMQTYGLIDQEVDFSDFSSYVVN